MTIVLLGCGWSAHGVHAGRASVCGRLEGRGLVDFRVLESHVCPPLYCPRHRLCSFIEHLGENLGDWDVIFWFLLWNYNALLWGSFALMENKSR